ncbi:tetranectin-like protein [Ciona intestinalis]
MPPLTPACVKEIFKNSSCTRELSQAAIELFAKKTTGKLSSWLKEKVHRAQVDPDSIESQLFLQICHQPRFIHSFSPEIPNLLLEPKGKTYEEAVEYCTSMNATLPTLKTQYQVDIIMSRALGSSNVTGYTQWWIGLDDVYAEGLYEWSSGEPHDQPYGHYTNWSPTRNGSKLAKDCVAADITDHLYWSEEDCAITLPFMCVEVNGCVYPATYGSIHRDECYHFRHDPFNLQPSPYTKPLNKLKKTAK